MTEGLSTGCLWSAPKGRQAVTWIVGDRLSRSDRFCLEKQTVHAINDRSLVRCGF